MAVSRDDQNTFLMIGGVLIICLIALVAVISSIWALIREPVNTVINSVSTFVRIQTLDYNFQIPVQYVATTPPPAPTPNPGPVINLPSISFTSVDEKDIDYNFLVNNSINGQLSNALFTDKQLEEKASKNEPVDQKDLTIQIPVINVNSPIVQGLDSDSLVKEGFWPIPSQRQLGQDEVIFLCNRRYFGPNDPKSCWYLDKVTFGNAITIQYQGLTLTYSVVGINKFAANNPLIYQSTEGEDLIKIVTTDPLESNENRLVILAKRVN